jgi:hypothetical protein
MDIDVMLCDHAQVVANKLFISGANIDRMSVAAGTPPPYVLNFAAAGIVRVPWQATNEEHKLSFRFVTQDGQPPQLAEGVAVGPEGIAMQMRFNVGRPPQMTIGDEQMVPFAFNLQALPLGAPGRFVLEFSLDGTQVRNLTFTLAVEPRTTGFGPAAIPPLRG